MSDTFYSFANLGTVKSRQRSDITVDTSTVSANPIELRVTDATVTAEQVYDALEYLADLFAMRDFQVIPTDVLL